MPVGEVPRISTVTSEDSRNLSQVRRQHQTVSTEERHRRISSAAAATAARTADKAGRVEEILHLRALQTGPAGEEGQADPASIGISTEGVGGRRDREVKRGHRVQYADNC